MLNILIITFLSNYLSIDYKNWNEIPSDLDIFVKTGRTLTAILLSVPGPFLFDALQTYISSCLTLLSFK